MKIWKRFNGDQLPEAGLNYLKLHESNGPGEPPYDPNSGKKPFYTPWASGWGGWCEAYYVSKSLSNKRNIQYTAENSPEWIVVFNDGGYYKVGATYMVWHTNPKTGNPTNTARWTKSSLHQAIMAIKRGETTPFDPNYQT